MNFDPKHLLDEFPHKSVPRDLDDNLAYRRQFREWLDPGGKEARDIMWGACRRDVLFFANALCWTLDSKRHPGKPVRPWITFKEFQDDLFNEVEEMWGPPDSDDQVGHDRCWVKVRDVGVSHIPLIAACRRLLCFEGQIFYLVSERAELVDDTGNPGAMFPKVDFIISRLPTFMRDGLRRKKLGFYYMDESGEVNLSRGTIKGVATTEVSTAATRPTGIIADEFGIWNPRKSIAFLAASSGASNSRLFMGTPKGQGNGFHKVATETTIPRTDIHWTQHPWHRMGLYRSGSDGAAVHLDDREFWQTKTLDWLRRNFPLIHRNIKADNETPLRDCYPFIRDGKVRSPYYDNECARTPFPWQVAQEHDLDFHGSGSPFYDTAKLSAYIERMSMPALQVGELISDPFSFEPTGFNETHNGQMHLWVALTTERGVPVPPRRHTHVIGVDVSAGMRASNSVISVWNCVTLNKVARYARNDLSPHRFAEVAYSVGKWFGDCQIIFESGGPGSGFGQRLKELEYSNVFWITDAKGKRKPYPGLHFEGEGKKNLLEDYGRALMDGEAVCRDRMALREGLQFQLGADSLVTHSDAMNKANPGGAKRNHGDAWMSDCLAWYRVKRFLTVDRKKVPTHIDEDETQRRIAEMEEKRYATSRW